MPLQIVDANDDGADQQYVEAAHRLGAAGYVLKTAPTAELLEAIRRAAAVGISFAVRRGRATRALSEREREVVKLVIDGRSNDEIGANLGIGAKTVVTRAPPLRAARPLVPYRAARAVREGWLDVPV